MPDQLSDQALDALTAVPERYAVYARDQRKGAHWKCLGTFGSLDAAHRFLMRVVDKPRTDWSVRREEGKP